MPRKPEPQAIIRAQVVLDEHDMSADGRFAVVVRRFVVGDRYRSHLWLVPLEGKGRPIQLTDGPVRDTGPRLAPDGSAVAFRRSAAAAPGKRHRGTSADPADEIARLRVLHDVDRRDAEVERLARGGGRDQLRCRREENIQSVYGVAFESRLEVAEHIGQRAAGQGQHE